MNTVDNSYIITGYQALFEIRVDYSRNRTINGTFNYVSGVLFRWMRNKFPQLDIPGDIRTFSVDRATDTASAVFVAEKCYLTIRTTNMDSQVARRQWITEAAVCKPQNIGGREHLYLAVKNSYTANTLTRDCNLCTFPSFVAEMDRNVGLLDEERKTGSLTIISSEDDLEKLQLFVSSPLRQFSAVVISEDTSPDTKILSQNGYHVDGDRLSQDLKYYAHVFYLPYALQGKWSDMVGHELGVFNGAVRTYYPDRNFEDTQSFNHPFMPKNKLMLLSYSNEKKDYAAGHAFRHILTHMIKVDNSRRSIAWSDLGIKFYADASRELMLQKSKKSTHNMKEAREALAYYKELYEEEKQARIDSAALCDQLENQLAEEENRVRRFSSININAQARIGKLTAQLKAYADNPGVSEYPKDWEDIPQWSDDNFGGRIYFHSKAIRSLKKAVYKDINDVCDALVVLGQDYYDYKTGGGLTRQDVDAHLAKLNMALTSDDLDMMKGEGDAYKVNYDNRTRWLENHIKKTTSTYGDDRTLRIYFFGDDDNSMIVIGALPAHLPNSHTS